MTHDDMIHTRNVMGEPQLYQMMRATIDRRIELDRLTDTEGLRILGEYFTGLAWEIERMKR